MAKKATRKQTASRGRAKKKTARKEPSRKTALVRGALAGTRRAIARKVLAGASQPDDAIEMLEREHRRFEALLKQGEETTERARKTRRELLDTLVSELNSHELMEEKVLYPALESHQAARDIVLEGYEEHHVADLIIEELHAVATDDEDWAAKFKVLKENIEHHIEEEEGEMFRVARGIFSREELLELGARMLALKTRGSGRKARRPRRR